MKKLKPVKFLNKSIKILLLGSGELGKELTIAAQRLGVTVVAVDSYANAPAMQVADSFEVINMLDGTELEKIVLKWDPDYIVPEVEALRTTKLIELEKKGHTVIPSAKATNLTMNRDAIRDLASTKLKLKTAKYAYANSEAELKEASTKVGYPNVVKPVMSSSGKGQSVVYTEKDIKKAWNYALKGMRGDTGKIIVEEFIKFESEITLLTVKQIDGPTLFCDPIGHRQERGDYQESWAPAQFSSKLLKKAQKMAKKITDELGGAGIFGVEFFVTKDDVYFSELSPRPHDTGMVTMISQNMNEFELHLKAILGLPITELKTVSPSASYVVLSSKKGSNLKVLGLVEALKQKDTEVRIFGKETAYKYRRMGVVLSQGKDIKQARRRAAKASKAIVIK